MCTTVQGRDPADLCGACTGRPNSQVMACGSGSFSVSPTSTRIIENCFCGFYCCPLLCTWQYLSSKPCHFHGGCPKVLQYITPPIGLCDYSIYFSSVQPGIPKRRITSSEKLHSHGSDTAVYCWGCIAL